MNIYCRKNTISMLIDYIEDTIFLFLPALLAERMIWPCPFFMGNSFQQLNYEWQRQKLLAGTCQDLVWKIKGNEPNFQPWQLLAILPLIYFMDNTHLLAGKYLPITCTLCRTVGAYCTVLKKRIRFILAGRQYNEIKQEETVFFHWYVSTPNRYLWICKQIFFLLAIKGKC